MHPTIMAIAVSTQFLTPISDAIPKLNVEATCRGSVEADKAMGLALPQSFDKCMSDENSARQQLGPIWSSYSPLSEPSVRRCDDRRRELCRSLDLSSNE